MSRKKNHLFYEHVFLLQSNLLGQSVERRVKLYFHGSVFKCFISGVLLIDIIIVSIKTMQFVIIYLVQYR